MEFGGIGRKIYSILNDEQKMRFENEKELDLSFGVQGLSRFRANVFQQRGATAMAIRPQTSITQRERFFFTVVLIAGCIQFLR